MSRDGKRQRQAETESSTLWSPAALEGTLKASAPSHSLLDRSPPSHMQAAIVQIRGHLLKAYSGGAAWAQIDVDDDKYQQPFPLPLQSVSITRAISTPTPENTRTQNTLSMRSRSRTHPSPPHRFFAGGQILGKPK